MTNHNPHTTALPIHAPDQKTKRWAALGVLMLPVLLVSIDNTVLAFAVTMLISLGGIAIYRMLCRRHARHQAQ